MRENPITAGTSCEDDIPEDFFADLENSEFLHTLEQEKTNDSFDEFLNHNDSRENSPTMVRRLDEIARLTEDIKRRKKKLEEELSKKGLSADKLQKELEDAEDEYDRNRERNSREQNRRRRRSRSRSTSRHRSHRRSRSPDKKNRRHRNRSRSASPSRRRGNRSRSRSPRNARSSSTHKNLTFLEELAQTFAQKGQAFPEKDLLLNSTAGAATSNLPNQVPFNPNIVEYPNLNMMHYATQPQLNPMIYPPPQYTTPIYYGMNPMTVVPGMSGVSNMAGVPVIPGMSVPIVPPPQPIPPVAPETKISEVNTL